MGAVYRHQSQEAKYLPVISCVGDWKRSQWSLLICSPKSRPDGKTKKSLLHYAGCRRNCPTNDWTSFRACDFFLTIYSRFEVCLCSREPNHLKKCHSVSPVRKQAAKTSRGNKDSSGLSVRNTKKKSFVETLQNKRKQTIRCEHTLKVLSLPLFVELL